MKLLDVLARESNLPLRRVLFLAVIAGLSDALVVVVINRSAEAASRGGSQLVLFLAFVVVLGIYVLSQRYILQLTALQVETTIKRIRIRLADDIRKADL